MGLFSFIKNAGKKLFGKDDQEATEAVKPTKEQKLKAEIEQLGLPISDVGVQISEMVTVTGTTQTNEEREKVILALGNVDCIGCVEDQIKVLNPEPEATFHVVQKGDTLSKVAKDVYGDPMKYPVIFEANKPMLSHPDKIYPGQTLRIPAL